MKRPSFQFYPGDWLRSADLRSCSIGARGLWIDMICLMHEGCPYGFLKVGDKVILPTNLARIVGATLPEVEGWLLELTEAGVCSVNESGCYHSRRMIRDEQVRESRASGGKLGGNPALKVNPKVENKDNLPPNLPPTPSSSSSSAKKVVGTRFALTDPPPDWVQFCQTQRPDLNAGLVFDGFRDHWIAKAGRDGVKLDWFATWRNWVRNEKIKQGGQHGKPAKTKLDVAAEGIARAAAKREQREQSSARPDDDGLFRRSEAVWP